MPDCFNDPRKYTPRSLKKASINGKNDLTLFLMWELWEFEQL
jgi:hypothetical protein